MTDLKQFMTEAKEGHSSFTGRTTTGMVIEKTPDTFVLSSGEVLQMRKGSFPIVRPATPSEQLLSEKGQHHFHSSDLAALTEAVLTEQRKHFRAYIEAARHRQESMDRLVVQMPCSIRRSTRLEP